MPTADALGLWEFPPEADEADMAALAAELESTPDAHGVVVAERTDHLTIQVVDGRITRTARAKLFVEQRGGFVLLRREEWPALRSGDRPRVMLTLRSSPSST